MPRAYAAERLAAAGEVDLVGARHAKAMAAAMTQAWVDRWSGAVGYRDWIERVGTDSQNARAAHAWARKHHDVDLALKMAPVSLNLNQVVTTFGSAEKLDIAEWLDRELAARPAAPDQLPARMALMRFWNEHDVGRSRSEAARTLELAQACGDRFAAYFSKVWQVRLCVQTRDIEAAKAALQQVNALEDAAWPPIRLWLGAEARSLDPGLVGAQGATHVELIERELAIVRLSGDAGHVTTSKLIEILALSGAAAEAATLGWQLLKELDETRNEYARVIVRNNLLGALLALSDTQAARPIARAAWPTARQFALHGDCADHMALLAALEQRWGAAASLMGYADAVYAGRGAQRWHGEQRSHEETLRLARAAMGDDAFERARAEGERLSDVEVEAIAFAHP